MSLDMLVTIPFLPLARGTGVVGSEHGFGPKVEDALNALKEAVLKEN